MIERHLPQTDSTHSMRPVAVVFFSAAIAVAVLLTATASFAVSPLGESEMVLATR